jgi:hypothetical protein
MEYYRKDGENQRVKGSDSERLYILSHFKIMLLWEVLKICRLWGDIGEQKSVFLSWYCFKSGGLSL